MSFSQHFKADELTILRERAQRLAQVAQQRTQAIGEIGLSLRVRGERFAVHLDALAAVYQNIPLTRVPCTPPHVSGVANVRGRILPVLDLGDLLDIPAVEGVGASSALVVAAYETQVVGFSLERVEDVIVCGRDDIAPFSNDFVTLRGAYVRGILPDGTPLLDLAAIIRDPSLDVMNT